MRTLVHPRRWSWAARLISATVILGLVAVTFVVIVLAHPDALRRSRALEVRIDTKLRPDGAVRLPDGPSDAWSSTLMPDGRAHFDLRRDRGDFCLLVDLWFRPRPGALPEIEVAARTQSVMDPSLRWPFFGLGGTVWVSSSTLPGAEDPPLVVAYDLEGDCGGSPVQIKDTLTVTAAELR